MTGERGILTLLMACLLAALPQCLRGQETWRPVFVDPDSKANWPAGEWTPVNSDSVREKLTGEMPAGFIAEAFYECVYSPAGGVGSAAGDEDDPQITSQATLIGDFRWTVDRPENTQPNISLGRPSVALYNLKPAAEVEDQGGKARWGQGADGQSHLLVPAGRSEITGQWQSLGSQVAPKDIFRLAMPTALSTSIRIRVPRDRVVEARNSVVLRLRSNPDSDTRVWEIRPDRAEATVIEIYPQMREARGTSVQMTREIDLRIGQSESTWRVDMTATFVGNRPRSVSVLVPNDAVIDAVTVGRETMNSVNPVEIAGERFVRIPVPDDADFRVQLRGRLVRLARRTRLPDIRIPDALIVSGRASITVSSPLEVEKVTASGYQQVLGDLDASSGDLLEFHQTEQSARIVVDAGPPEPTLAASVLTVFDTSAAIPEQVSAIELSATTGTTYLVEISWPADWLLTAVESFDEDGIADWSLERRFNADALATIRLTRPVTPTRTRRLILRGRRARSEAADSLTVTRMKIDGRFAASQTVISAGSSHGSYRPDVGMHVTAIDMQALALQSPFANLIQDHGEFAAAYQIDGNEPVVWSYVSLPSGKDSEPASLTPGEETKATSRQAEEDRLCARSQVKVAWADESEPVLRTAVTFMLTGDAGTPPEIVLPPGADWIAARVGDRAIPTVADGVRRLLPGNFSGKQFTVEYLQRVEGIGVRTSASIGLPQLQVNEQPVPILASDVAIRLPGRCEVTSSGTQPYQMTSSYRVSAYHRLFGPLGRGFQHRWFRPWSAAHWRHLFFGEQPDANSQAAADETTTTIFIPVLPQNLSVVVTNPMEALAISWQFWWVSLAVVTALRSLRPLFWRQTLVLLITIAGLVAIAVPPEFGLVSGGVFSGAWLALLLPRVVVRKPNKRDLEEVTPTSTCSTAVYQRLATPSVFLAFTTCYLTACLAQEPATRTATIDVLIPLAADETPASWAAETVFVRPEVAVELQRRRSAGGHYIRDVEANVTYSDDGAEVACVFDVVRTPHGSGVLIPLASEAVVDAGSIAVNGEPVTPLPVTGGLFIPTAKATSDDVEVRAVFTVSRPVRLAANDSLVYVLPLAGMPSGKLRIGSVDSTPIGGTAMSEGAGLFRLLPDRRVMIPVSAPSDTPSDPAFNGQLTYGKSGLMQELAFELDSSGFLAHSEVKLIFPPNVVLSDLPATTITRPTDSPELSDTRNDSIAKAFPTVDLELGRQVATIRFEDLPLRSQTHIVIRGWGLDRSNTASPEAYLPEVLIGERPASVNWAVDGGNDPNRATAGSAAGATIPANSDATSPTVPPRPPVAVAPSIKRIFHSGTVRDDRIDWQIQFDYDTGSTNAFSLPLALDVPLTVERISVQASGRNIPSRIVARNEDYNILFDGAIEGLAQITIQGTLTRPNKGSVLLPNVSLVGSQVIPPNGELAINNASSSPAELQLPGSEARELWNRPAVFEDWPANGPTAVIVSTNQQLPLLESGFVSLGDGIEQVHLALRTKGAPTRRRIHVPDGLAVVAVDRLPVTATEEITVATSSAQPLTVTTFDHSNTQSPDTINVPAASRVKASEVWVVLAQSDRRVPLKGKLRPLEDLPAWMANELPADFKGSSYTVDAGPVRLATRPTQIGPTTIDQASHCIWRGADGSLAGLTHWFFARPGTFEYVPHPDRVTEAILVDNDQLLSPEQAGFFTVSSEATIWWSTKPNSAILPLPKSDPHAAEEALFVCSGVNSYRIVSADFSPAKPIPQTAPNSSDENPERATDEKLANRLAPIKLVSPPTDFASRFQNDEVVQYVRTGDSTKEEPRIASANVANWMGESLFVIVVVSALTLVWKLTPGNVWERIADQLAARPRAVSAVFGLVWWLFLVPSVLGVFIMITVLYLVVFRPDTEKEVRIGDPL